MKSFLVLVENHSCMLSTLQTALLLGEHFNAHLAGVAIDPGRTVIGAGETFYIETSPCSARHRRYEQARKVFVAFRDKYIAGRQPTDDAAATFGWAENDIIEDSQIGHYGRNFDLIVVSKPQQGRLGPRWSTLCDALLNSGRPVLICPEAPPHRIASNILVHDDGSVEAARAISLSQPLLKKAERVTVLSECASAQARIAMINSLRRNGVTASVSTYEGDFRDSSHAILAKAAAMNCDLIVAGGYTSARFPEFLFGRRTNRTIEKTAISILVAH